MRGGEPPRLARMPGKREVAALYILYSLGPTLNYGEAVEALRERLCVTKRTARGIVKRLRRIGAAAIEVRGGEAVVTVESPEELLRRVAEAYVEGRRRRCRLPPSSPGEAGEARGAG
ncbi:hypothetical protein ACAM_0691 [Aeropyrum camini SY1 = JCM 12091]|uniref:Uncharacterized protein n=2 Tax=Aeropyrum camini TaxID=229980 RepID=U3TDS1_9CREN|nr:hypothetical protein ACAM_0691 [Aeropyrum camini SY1 = JCM 12091]